MQVNELDREINAVCAAQLEHFVTTVVRRTGANSLDDVEAAALIGQLFPERFLSALQSMCNRGLCANNALATNMSELQRFIEVYSMCVAQRCAFATLYDDTKWPSGSPLPADHKKLLTLSRVKELSRSLDIGHTVDGACACVCMQRWLSPADTVPVRTVERGDAGRGPVAPALDSIQDVMQSLNTAFSELLSYQDADVTIDDHHIAGRGKAFADTGVQTKRNRTKRRYGVSRCARASDRSDWNRVRRVTQGRFST